MEIDAKENLFYDIFPEIIGFENAQFYEVNMDLYVVRISVIDYSRQKLIRKKFNFREFYELQKYVDDQPILTDEAKQNVGIDLAFLRGDEILKTIKTGAGIKIKRKKGLRLTGTFLNYEDHQLTMKTLLGERTISIYNIKKIFIRESIVENTSWKPYIFGFTAFLGVGIIEYWNENQSYRSEIKWFNRASGAVVGLFFAPKLYRKINVIFSPVKSYSLSAIKH